MGFVGAAQVAGSTIGGRIPIWRGSTDKFPSIGGGTYKEGGGMFFSQSYPDEYILPPLSNVRPPE